MVFGAMLDASPLSRETAPPVPVLSPAGMVICSVVMNVKACPPVRFESVETSKP